MALEQDQRISEVVAREQSRLRNFIRRRVPDPRDAEDILQDVFYRLVEANRRLMPIDHMTAWLFRVPFPFASEHSLVLGRVSPAWSEPPASDRRPSRTCIPEPSRRTCAEATTD